MSIHGIFQIEKWDFQRQSILEGLPAADLELLTAGGAGQLYKKGQIIFREDGYASGIYYIISGKVKKYKVTGDGREQIIYVAGAAELLGYHAVLAGDHYPDFASVMEDSQILFIPKEDFLAAVHRSDELNQRLLKTLSHEFLVLGNSLTLYAQKPVRERLALQLVVVREKYKQDFTPGAPVEINMSRDDLANLVGTARENVIRILSELKSEGILETRGRKIIVLDVKRLVRIANYG